MDMHYRCTSRSSIAQYKTVYTHSVSVDLTCLISQVCSLYSSAH